MCTVVSIINKTGTHGFSDSWKCAAVCSKLKSKFYRLFDVESFFLSTSMKFTFGVFSNEFGTNQKGPDLK